MFRNREKRGISTIIAAVFMIAVIVLGLGALTSGLAFQNKLGQVVTETTLAETEQIKERIELRDVRIETNNKFNITLVNTGILPLKIVRAWVTNTTDTNGWHRQYDNLNKLINPGGVLKDFGQDISLVAKTDKSYEIKLVTERGTTAIFKIANGNDAKLHVKLTATPNTVPTGQRVTITMLVTHNNTFADAVLNIEPQITSITVSPPGIGSATLVSGYPIPAKDANIIQGGTRSYTWVYEVLGQNNTQFTVVGKLKDGKSNTDTITFTTRLVKVTATDYATTSGLLTVSFTSFRYAQQGDFDWKEGWGLIKNKKTAFNLTLTNNNVTGTLWISKYTMFNIDPIGSTNDVSWYITNETSPGGGTPNVLKAFKCPPFNGQFSDEYCLSVPAGGTRWLTIAADGPNGGPGAGAVQLLPNAVDRYSVFIVVYGKFCNIGQPKDCAGTQYGQNLPFMAISAT